MTQHTRTITILAEEGLHARPAKQFAQTAKDAGITVTVATEGGKPVNAASILALLSLGAGKGDTVTRTAEGTDAEAVLDRLQRVLTEGHDGGGE